MDEDGILWYEGRIDEMIKCSGFRISPTEVEDIAASIPGVVESVAFGVDDLSLGQVVNLAVVTDNATLTPNDVSSFCREKMPAYMIPTHIHLFSQAFPRTANGKLDRPKIIRDCRNRIELDQ
jgi:acyl-coenzyme A synthetase/AMP-(fatty) acid ligase